MTIRKRSDGHYQCSCGGFDGDHDPKCPMLREFPIQRGGTIPWWLAEEAFSYYHEKWPGQSLERLAERGGFGTSELLMFIRRDTSKCKRFYEGDTK